MPEARGIVVGGRRFPWPWRSATHRHEPAYARRGPPTSAEAAPRPVVASVAVDGEAGTIVSVASARDVHLHTDLHLHLAARYGVRTPVQLPPDVEQFTGRQIEVERLLATLSRQVEGPVLVSAIDGKPGIGKSALALHVAHRLRGRFPDGQLYINLQGAHAGGLEPLPPMDVLGRFIRSLGGDDAVIPAGVEEATARYRSLLAERRILVVLDDARDAAQVRPLLPATPTCAVLITSRSMLTDLDGARHLSLDVLSPEEAAELLCQLAGTQRVVAARADAARIAELCGHLPLALRIAGARLAAQPGWPLAALAARLADERHRLDEFAHGDLDVAAGFAISYRALTSQDAPGGPASAEVFRLLGLLPGPDFTAPVVAALIDRPLRDAEAALERLVIAQLVERPRYEDREAPAEPLPARYRLHDLLRLFARRLADGGEPADADAARGRASAYYLSMARRATVLLRPAHLRTAADEQDRFETRAEALVWLASERKNLIAAASQAAAEGPPAHAWQLAQALFRFFDLRRYLADWRDVNEAALAAARAQRDRHAEATALRDLGVIAEHLRQYDVAVGHFLEALDLFGTLGDREDEEGKTLNHLARVYRLQRRFDAAIACGEQGLRLHRALGDRHGEARALDNLGVVARQLRRFDDAEVSLHAAMRIFAEVDDRHAVAITLANLGDVARHAGRWDQASARYEGAMPLLVEADDRFRQAVILCDLGRVWLAEGRVSDAIEQFQRSLVMRTEVDDRHGEAVTLHSLAEAHRSLGQLDDAVRFHLASLPLREEVGHCHGQGLTLLSLGATLEAMGRLDAAANAYAASHEVLLETSDEHNARQSEDGLRRVLAPRGGADDGSGPRG